MLNAGRGNPNWVAVNPRAAFFDDDLALRAYFACVNDQPGHAELQMAENQNLRPAGIPFEAVLYWTPR